MQQAISVKDKTILITGASRGIGQAIAKSMRDAGAIVYGCGSRPQSIEWLEADPGIEGRVLDVREPGAAATIIAEIIARHGRLDTLINNAGISSHTPAGSFKEDEMEAIIDTNFKGVFRACQAYYKAQRKAGGNIINVASVLGMVGTTLASIYCGTKGAVLQLTRALAVEWAGSGFRLNAICPGFVETDMTAGIQKRPTFLEKIEKATLLGRLGKPEDMTGAALYLASDASSYMTGQSIVLDGGLMAQ